MSKAAREAGREERRAQADLDPGRPQTVGLDNAVFAAEVNLGTVLFGADPAIVIAFEVNPAAGPNQIPLPPVVVPASPELVAAFANAVVEAGHRAFAAMDAAAQLETEAATRATCAGCGAPIFGALVEAGRCLPCQQLADEIHDEPTSPAILDRLDDDPLRS